MTKGWMVTQIICAALSAQTSLAQGPPDIVWENGEHVYSVEGIAYSADGSLVVSGANHSDCSFKLWMATDGSPAGSYSVYPHSIQSLDIAPDKRHVAVGYIVSDYPPGGVAALWDVELGEELWNTGGCFVDLSADGSMLASGGGGVNRYLCITRVSDGVELHSIYTGSYISDVAYSPTGLLVATANSDNTVNLWDAVSGSLNQSLSGHTDDVRAVAFSPDGQLVASGAGGWDEPSDSSIKIWRVADGELLDTLEGHEDWVYALAFSPSANILVSSGRNGSRGNIKYWSLADGEMIEYFDESAAALDLAFSPDGQYLAYGSAFGDVILTRSGISTAVADQSGLAKGQILDAPAPNPLRSASTLRFNLDRAAIAHLSIHDVQGRRIATLLNGEQPSGAHAVKWDGRDAKGARVAPGVYFARLSSKGGISTQKIVVIH